MIGNQRKGKIFEQDDNMTKKVCLEIAEFYGKLNPTTFFLIGFCQWKITLIGMLRLKIQKFFL